LWFKLPRTSSLLIQVLPFFFGRSAAVTEYLPQCVDRARLACPQLRVRVADCLVDIGVQADTRIAQILAALVRFPVLFFLSLWRLGFLCCLGSADKDNADIDKRTKTCSG
jgi:hypothetical protein